MENPDQLNFYFSDEQSDKSPHRYADCKRALVAWFACQNPSGIGLKVATRFSRYYADVAAFWSVPRKKLLHPEKTVVVEIRTGREKCWPECARKDELLPCLRQLKEQKAQLEAVIRKTEPELRDSDSLFEDFDIWDYSRSGNRDYQRCCREIEETEHSLYNGSRFEQIRRARVANFLYLAVPRGAVHPYELADGWGLLYLNPDFGVEEVKQAEHWDCPEENKFHLVQNIAISNLKNTLFSLGIRLNSENATPEFLPVPHRRISAKKKKVNK